MSKQTELLNMIATEFNISDKNTCISIAIKMIVDAGQTVDKAFDLLFGEGSYAKMASDIYDSIKAA